MKSLKEFREAVRVRRFPGRTTTVNVSKDVIERAHAVTSKLMKPGGAPPFVEIKHNPKENTFEIHTRLRGKNGSPEGPAVVDVHDVGSFIQHTNRALSLSHPDFSPRATHVQMEMSRNKRNFRFTLGR